MPNGVARPDGCLSPDCGRAGVADGVVAAQRAAFKCDLCRAVVWQQPEDFIRVGAWPASLSSQHLRLDEQVQPFMHITGGGGCNDGIYVVSACRTVFAQSFLQLWDSLKLHIPAMSMSAFLKAITDMTIKLHPTQVGRY